MNILFSLLNVLRPLSVLLLVVASTSASAETFDPSWSLDFAIEPKETSISGQAVSELNDELTHVSIINCENGSLNQQQCQQIADSGGQLDMLVDGNQDGEFERWGIAVGKLRNGEYAKVLLVQDDRSGKVLQLLLVESATPGFSALYFQQGVIMWGMCLSCDVVADIVWQQDAYQVSWLPNQYRAWDNEALVDNR
jgi:hypothetical protein